MKLCKFLAMLFFKASYNLLSTLKFFLRNKIYFSYIPKSFSLSTGTIPEN